ncbi:hypothetical protein [Xanthomonas phage XPP9]|nr:hypothetical protein [Xanthomonas phage XPP9]
MSDNPTLGAPFEAQFDSGRMQDWIMRRLMRQIHTAALVRVVAVYPTSGSVGFVDVTPMVLQQTTDATVLPAAPLYRLPYLRLQGGLSAVILDPAVGDIGLATFAERDITAAVSTRKPGPAPTDRAHDMGDGLYLGGFLNADPTQYVHFLPGGGVNIVTTGNVNVQAAGTGTLTASSWTVQGPVAFADPITAPQATIGGIPFTTHRHTGVSTGSGTSGTPV